jgi:hypothetical protein
MENQARFDLNKALSDWKAELAGQPGIGAENIRELETHLLESLNAFKKDGCSDEEAFFKARRKLGSTNQLGTEFAKENLQTIWRDRVFWMTTVPFFMTLFYLATEQLLVKLSQIVDSILGLTQSPVTYAVFQSVPQLLILIAFGSGILFRRMYWIFANRWRFAAAGVIGILGASLIATYSTELRNSVSVYLVFQGGFLFFAVLIWPKELTAASSVKLSTAAVWRDRFLWVGLANLAISVWNLVPSISVAGIERLQGLMNYVERPWIVALYLTIWLLPMAVVGLLLASTRLSALERWLRTRWRLGVVTGTMLLVWLGQVLLLSQLAMRPKNMSAGEWNFRLERVSIYGVISGVALIAIMLRTMPSHSGRRQKGNDSLRVA